MTFSQIEFVIFISVVMAFLAIVRHHRARKLMLLAASYYCYAYWDWRFLSLLLAVTLLDYCVARGLGRTSSPGGRKGLLAVSVVYNLGVLGFFKYFNFFAASLTSLIEPLGLHCGTLNIVLPLGISFITFRTMSYVIDVYRGKIDACRDIFDYALFVSFFPLLLAGPIVRAPVLLPQLKTNRKLTWQGIFEGFNQFIFGLFKKVVIADRLAILVDGVFDNAGVFDGPTTWLAAACYAGQIYCDFSGYSDMAIGTARAMGFDVPENFNYPYISRNVTEFWRRWHISLSTWLRDYLYIPLGGNRKGARRTYINLMLTMVLGGLWHGAAWTFVLWGALHGSALVIHKKLSSARKHPDDYIPGLMHNLACWALTMIVVIIAWVFFRSTGVGNTSGFVQAMTLLKKMFVSPAGVGWYPPGPIAALIAMALAHAMQATRFAHLRTLPAARWYTPVVLTILLWMSIVFAAEGFRPFVYAAF